MINTHPLCPAVVGGDPRAGCRSAEPIEELLLQDNQQVRCSAPPSPARPAVLWVVVVVVVESLGGGVGGGHQCFPSGWGGRGGCGVG